MKCAYSSRVHKLYLLQTLGVLVCCAAVQFLAGASVISEITGLDFTTVTVIISMIALSYSMLFGIKASIITDFFKISMIIAIGSFIVPWVYSQAGGWSMFMKGLGGVKNSGWSLWDQEGFKIFWTFGIPSSIGLLSGPFADQAFWQRGFATTQEMVKKAFYKGAAIFATVPLLLCVLGFLAAGNNLQISNTQLTNLITVKEYLPFWVLVPFIFMLLSGLVSALDTHFTAISSVAGHDLATCKLEIKDDKTILKYSRASMVVMCILGVGIANIPGIKILYLWLFYGSLRSATMLPTILSLISKKKFKEGGVFWGILLALLIGLPIFAYGTLLYKKSAPNPFELDGYVIALVGSILTLFTPFITMWIGGQKK
jgi:Na+/proline symporter